MQNLRQGEGAQRLFGEVLSSRTGNTDEDREPAHHPGAQHLETWSEGFYIHAVRCKHIFICLQQRTVVLFQIRRKRRPIGLYQKERRRSRIAGQSVVPSDGERLTLLAQQEHRASRPQVRKRALVETVQRQVGRFRLRPLLLRLGEQTHLVADVLRFCGLCGAGSRPGDPL